MTSPYLGSPERVTFVRRLAASTKCRYRRGTYSPRTNPHV